MKLLRYLEPKENRWAIIELNDYEFAQTNHRYALSQRFPVDRWRGIVNGACTEITQTRDLEFLQLLHDYEYEKLFKTENEAVYFGIAVMANLKLRDLEYKIHEFYQKTDTTYSREFDEMLK